MLQLSGSLLDKPVLSLRTGGVVATTISPIINPNNLKIEGFYCEDAFDRKKRVVLLYQDIRDVIPQGLVVNDYDVLAEPAELVRLKDIMDLSFDVIGKRVETASKQKVGKVVDYATEANSMFIQKLYVAQSMMKNLTSGNLAVDRTQIVEITDKRVIIHDLAQTVPARASALA